MARVRISYKSEEEKAKIIELLTAGATVKEKGKVFQKGEYFNIYLDVR